MHSQLQLLRRPHVGYVVMDGTVTVGWIRQGIIGLGGYPTRVDAYFAADAAAALLVSWSRTREARVPIPFAHPVPAEERVRLDDRVVARLVTPRECAERQVDGFGFEMAVPNEMWLSVMLELAQRMHGATSEWRMDSCAGGTPQGVA